MKNTCYGFVLAAVLSLLTSVAGLPEVDGGATLAEIQDGREHEG